MISKERRLLEQIIKQWAQNHTVDYAIADYDNSEKAMETTQSHLTWLIANNKCMIDLMSLVDTVDVFIENSRKRRYSDGMICNKCKEFYMFAGPNQEDGTLICYSCRSSPYI